MKYRNLCEVMNRKVKYSDYVHYICHNCCPGLIIWFYVFYVHLTPEVTQIQCFCHTVTWIRFSSPVWTYQIFSYQIFINFVQLSPLHVGHMPILSAVITKCQLITARVALERKWWHPHLLHRDNGEPWRPVIVPNIESWRQWCCWARCFHLHIFPKVTLGIS